MGRANEDDERRADDVERGHRGVDRRRPERIEQAAERRADDARSLARRRHAGDGARQRGQRHEVRKKRGARGVLECARGPEDRDDGEDAIAAEPAAEAADRKRGIAGGLGHLAGDHDEPAIAAIGDLADDERQGDGRHELHEPDEAEVEGAARQRIELPPDGNRLHVQGERDENSRRPEQCEGRTSYRQPARGAFGACRGTSVQANVAGCAR